MSGEAAGIGWRAGLSVAFLCCGFAATGVRAQDPRQLIESVVAHENEASAHRGRYVYMSEERSDRTNGHLWRERVAETDWGKVRYLQAEDGQPLSGDRLAAEKARLAGDAQNPESFKQKEAARGEDEQHAREMMKLLPKAFLFDPPNPDGQYLRIAYKPNPDFSPGSLEERVLHSMVGSVLIDPKLMRTREIEGRLPQDVSIGFGFLATVKAGSNFSTTREHLEGVDWKTETLHTDINGKAMFLKTIARKQEGRHWDFKKIADGMSVADAVKLVEQ